MSAARVLFGACLVVASLSLETRLSYAQWRPDGAPVCTDASTQEDPQMTSDGAGGAIITWMDHRGANYDIWAQRLNAAGVPQWTLNGVPVCTGNGEHDLPVIVSDGSGGAIIAWKDHRGANYDIWAQRLNSAGVPQWTLDGVAVCTGNGEHNNPAIASDGAHGAIVTWEDLRNGVSNPDIYAQRMSPGGAPQWTSDGVALCNAASYQTYPRIISDGAAGAIVAWEDSRSGAGSDIYAQRVLASGVVDGGWPVDGRVLCAAAGKQIEHQLASDGAGGAIVVWHDERTSGDPNLYAQHVRASGAVDGAWPVDGLAVCTAAAEQNFPQLIPDGSGGAIVTWEDYRLGVEIYAHHILASGAVDGSWPVDGSAVCIAPNRQEAPLIVTDGGLGAIVGWEDQRSGQLGQVYANHLLQTGGLDGAWPTTGRALCSASVQQFQVMISDGVGGAIDAWVDYRNGNANWDIYAARVYSSGAVAAVAAPGPVQLQLDAPHPNPARAEAEIDFSLPVSERVSIGVYDVAGQRIRVLAAEQEYSAGRQSLDWDGRNEVGSRMGPGLYFVRVTVAGVSVARSVTLLQ